MNVLHKKLFRYVRANWGQALAIAAVITCGTATYISLASAHRNLELTRDTYYEQYRLADFFIMFEQAPMTAVFQYKALESVHDARGRIVKDVGLDVPGQEEPRAGRKSSAFGPTPVSYTHLRAHETVLELVCRLLLEKKNNIHTYYTP